MSTAPTPPPGALVISLDFELHWGVRDLRDVRHPYTARLYGARSAVPRMLELFEEFGIAATWATVGLLFARSRAERERHAPRLRPKYWYPELSAYAEPVGDNARIDPLHYAPDLIARIAATPRQEIATHTFSHYFCNEPGQTADTFDADIAAARSIAAARGIELRSIVFPRNQYNPAYDSVLLRHGIVAYRGNPDSWIWRFDTTRQSAGHARRAGRLLDAYVPLSGSALVDWSRVVQPNGLANVAASFFLRPYDPRARRLEPMRLRRLVRAVHMAARRHRIVHLWWHPHNFGSHLEENLAFLRAVLKEYRSCRERYGMQSLGMHEVAQLAGARAAPDPASGMLAAATPRPLEVR